MITAADADRHWRRVPVPVPPAWDISGISLAQGEIDYRLHTSGVESADG